MNDITMNEITHEWNIHECNNGLFLMNEITVNEITWMKYTWMFYTWMKCILPNFGQCEIDFMTLNKEIVKIYAINFIKKIIYGKVGLRSWWGRSNRNWSQLKFLEILRFFINFKVNSRSDTCCLPKSALVWIID